MKASGYPVPVAKWLKGRTKIESGDNVEVIAEGDTHKLILKSATLDDDDDFYCQLSNEHGTVEAIFSILIEEEKIKPSFVEALQDQEVLEGDDVEFNILIESSPNAEVEWQLNGEAVFDGEGIQILVEEGQSHVLIIESCELEDTGVITCIAKNVAGESSSEAKLVVNAKGKTPF